MRSVRNSTATATRSSRTRGRRDAVANATHRANVDPRRDTVRTRRLRRAPDPACLRAVRQDRAMDGPPIHPLVLGVLDRVLGHYQLSAPTGIEIGPGEPARASAPGRRAVSGAPTPRELVVNVMWPLDDFTEANGTTRVVPGSHRWVDELPTADVETRSVEMAAGAALIYLGSLWHGGGANRTDAARLGRRAALRRRMVAPGREPRARVPPAVRPATCRSGCRSCSATTSSRRSSATSTAATRRSCSAPDVRNHPDTLDAPACSPDRACSPSRPSADLDRAGTSTPALNCGSRRGQGRVGEGISMMQRFWSVLAVQLGKHAGLVSVIGLRRHPRARARDHPARVRDRPGQLPQQGRPGLQGQRRLPGPVRRPGDAHRHHDGRGPHGRRAVHRRRIAPSSQKFHDDVARRPATVHGVITPLTIAEFADSLVQSPDGNPTTSIAGRRAADRADEGAARDHRQQAARLDGRERRRSNASTRSPPPSARSTTPSG